MYMDFGWWIHFYQNEQRVRNALLRFDVETLDRFNRSRGPAFVVVNDHFIQYGHPYLGINFNLLSVQRRLGDVQASRLFDAAEVRIYITP